MLIFKFFIPHYCAFWKNFQDPISSEHERKFLSGTDSSLFFHLCLQFYRDSCATEESVRLLVEAAASLHDSLMVKTTPFINFIVVYEENTALIKRVMFLTLLLVNIYDRSTVQI